MDRSLLFADWAASLPLLIVLTVGLILCGRRLETTGRRARLVAAAIVIALVTRYVLPALTTSFFIHYLNDIQNMRDLRVRTFVNTLFFDVPRALAWSLVIYALLLDGKKE